MHPDADAHMPNNEQRPSSVSPQSEVVTPKQHKAQSLVEERPDMHTRTPGNEDTHCLHASGNLMSKTPSGESHAPGMSRGLTHLPTPQNSGNRTSYLLTRTPMSTQNFQPDLESNALPTEFQPHASPSLPPPIQSHSIPTPESSPLVARSRSNGPHLSRHTNMHDLDNDYAAPNKRDGLRSRVSTPPRTLSRQTSTRPATPMSQSRPTTPLQQSLTEQSPPPLPGLDKLHPNNSTTIRSQGVKEDLGGNPARLRAQARRLAPPGTGRATLPLDFGRQDGSLLWSSVNVDVIESAAKGKQIALFQETSDESFEESLMAGGYRHYRSGRPWKLEDAEAPKQPGDAMGEEGHGSKLVLTEEEKRKKTRLAAFFDPPRVTSSTTHLSPVEMEGCGRVLMRVEPSEPQTPPRPIPKTKRSRKRKKTSTDMKHDVKDNVAAPEDSAVDGPNWPDTVFPWWVRLAGQGGLSGAEREERLRYIESFLDRDSDEDDSDEGHPPSSQRSLHHEGPLRYPRSGRGKIYSHPSHSKGRRCGTTMASIIPSDPADARTALLSKKSIRAVQLRLLRRRDADRSADGDNGKILCICRSRDDGRPLVQCDACRTWYHLECVGIQSTAELGREEDPWFCANCAEVKSPAPVIAPPPEPTFVQTGDDVHGDGADVEGYDPPFLNAGLESSPAMLWMRPVKPPTTPPRTQYAPHTSSGSSWDEPPSSSSRVDPRTPQFHTASALGDMARVYGTIPGRSVEVSSTVGDGSAFEPTSTPSRGINFRLPFTTPKDGKSLWQGFRGGGHELFHTPRHFGEDGSVASLRYGQPLLYHGRVGEDSEGGPSGVPGLHQTTGSNNVTPVERDTLGGLKRIQVLESPLGAKRSRKAADS